MAKIVQAGASPLHYVMSTNSTTYTPTTGASGMIEINISDYDASPEVYLEVVYDTVYTGAPDSPPTGRVRLYDATSGAAVIGSEITSLFSFAPNWARARSGNCASYFSAGAKNCYLQLRVTRTDLTLYVRLFRVIFKQNGIITKTVTYIPVGGFEVIADVGATEIMNRKRWVYTSSEYNGTVAIYFCATMIATDEFSIITARLRDTTAGTNITDITCEGLLEETFLKSENIAASLISGNELTCQTFRAADTTGGILRNAFLQIVQTNIPTDGTGKLTTIYDLLNNVSIHSGIVYDPDEVYGYYEPASWDGTRTLYAEYSMKSNNAAGTAYGQITDDGTQITNSEATTVATAYTRVRSANAITEPTDASVIDSGGKSNNVGGSSTLCSSRLVIAVVLQAGSQIKKVSGVTLANIKKIAGVAIASVKKVAGVANS